MPGKLVVVVALLVGTIALNVVSGSLISAVIQGALLFGVLVGNEGVRQFLRFVAAVNILVVVVMSIPSIGLGSDAEILTIVAVSVAINGYFIWALGQADVREWMFRKSFKLDEEDDQVPKATARPLDE